MSASLPATRFKTSARGGRFVAIPVFHIKMFRNRRRGSSNRTCVENSFGLLTASSHKKKQLGRVTQL